MMAPQLGIVTKGVDHPLHFLFIFREGLALFNGEQMYDLFTMLLDFAGHFMQKISAFVGPHLAPHIERGFRCLYRRFDIFWRPTRHRVDDLLGGRVLYGNLFPSLPVRQLAVDIHLSHRRLLSTSLRGGYSSRRSNPCVEMEDCF